MTLFNFLLIIHVIGGSVSLLVGSYILSTKKGDQRHKKWGIIFFYTMLTAALISLPMSYLHSNHFLFIVGVFTTYMLMSGKRYLAIKNTNDVTLFDWLITCIMFVFGILFIIFGIIRLIDGVYFGLVILVFGMIGLSFVRQDYTNFKGNSTVLNVWLTAHIQRMTGSYIASSTAFLVVNNTFLPPIIAWMLPTIILTPLIIKWSRKNAVLK